jgi:AraC-like DNA-binding protein
MTKNTSNKTSSLNRKVCHGSGNPSRLSELLFAQHLWPYGSVFHRQPVVSDSDDLALNLGISPRHFKRRFKRATGDSPLAYLQRLRIEAAKQKLELTQETVNEITWQVGYEDSNSFRRLFKKCTGLSPREYRERFAPVGSPLTQKQDNTAQYQSHGEGYGI